MIAPAGRIAGTAVVKVAIEIVAVVVVGAAGLVAGAVGTHPAALADTIYANLVLVAGHGLRLAGAGVAGVVDGARIEIGALGAGVTPHGLRAVVQAGEHHSLVAGVLLTLVLLGAVERRAAAPVGTLLGYAVAVLAHLPGGTGRLARGILRIVATSGHADFAGIAGHVYT